jgi:hypothetical protein
MSDQVTKKSAVAPQSEVCVLEIALTSSTSRSDALLCRIATWFFILVVGLLTVFGYHASSICITVVLAGLLVRERHQGSDIFWCSFPQSPISEVFFSQR